MKHHKIYYMDDNITIRDMRQEDAAVITQEEIAQGWDAAIDKYEMRLRDRQEKKAVVLVAEYQGNVAGEYSDKVYLGVGLHSGYGSAQRMYVKRGYIPDGSGVWYGDKVCEPYAACCNDDNLVLYMLKILR